MSNFSKSPETLDILTSGIKGNHRTNCLIQLVDLIQVKMFVTCTNPVSITSNGKIWHLGKNMYAQETSAHLRGVSL